MNSFRLNADSKKVKEGTGAYFEGIPGSAGTLLKFALPVLFTAAWTQGAWAYVDPGTTSAVFSGLGYIIGMMAVGAGFLFRPMRKLLVWIKRRLCSDKDHTAV